MPGEALTAERRQELLIEEDERRLDYLAGRSAERRALIESSSPNRYDTPRRNAGEQAAENAAAEEEVHEEGGEEELQDEAAEANEEDEEVRYMELQPRKKSQNRMNLR